MKRIRLRPFCRWTGTVPAAAALAGTVLAGTVLAGTVLAAPARAAVARGSVSVRPGIGAAAVTASRHARNRRLRPGMRGPDVRWVQRRLARLHYYPGPRDGRFGADTLEAVWAFQEVQRIAPTGQVGRRMRAALAHPRYPRRLVPRGGAERVEVDLGHHVLYVYHHNRIVLISHVSSGGGYYYCSAGSCAYADTPTGNFRTLWRVHGWHVSPLGEMYNPVFFDAGFAIHGDTDVPLAPVSHGCVRIPMDIASFFPRLVPRNGIPVYVRA
ncbi:MAG TPA: L,D-transpeptidase family protein [Streptosporangiaceae bacterium]|jgi:hypothetical protein